MRSSARHGAARFDLRDAGAGIFDTAAGTRQFLIDLVASERRDPHLPDGLISRMVAEHGADFDDVELGGLCDGVFLGGYETSASMLSLGTYVLTRSPDAWATLQRGDPAEVDRVVEELLRYVCPVQLAFPRIARHDVVVGGTQVREGDIVVVSLTGAGRDPARHVDPERFDPTTAVGRDPGLRPRAAPLRRRGARPDGAADRPRRVSPGASPTCRWRATPRTSGSPSWPSSTASRRCPSGWVTPPRPNRRGSRRDSSVAVRWRCRGGTRRPAPRRSPRSPPPAPVRHRPDDARRASYDVERPERRRRPPRPRRRPARADRRRPSRSRRRSRAAPTSPSRRSACTTSRSCATAAPRRRPRHRPPERRRDGVPARHRAAASGRARSATSSSPATG